MLSFRLVKLAKILRMYRMITMIKMVRIFRHQKFVEVFIARMSPNPDTQSILSSVVRMVSLLHFIGCFWAIIAVMMEAEDRETWMVAHYSLDNQPVSNRYVASCYWAVVTISTVGYGDITPTNNTEVAFAIVLVFFGCVMYSYVISSMTRVFIEK